MVDDEENAILTDFGISRMLGSSGYTTKSLAGSVRWMATELLTFEDETVSRESDVWSFGMTILEVCNIVIRVIMTSTLGRLI